MAFFTSGRVGGVSISWLMSTSGSRLIASSLMWDGLFRTASKCSAHFSRMRDFSVMSVVPSALSKGDELAG